MDDAGKIASRVELELRSYIESRDRPIPPPTKEFLARLKSEEERAEFESLVAELHVADRLLGDSPRAKDLNKVGPYTLGEIIGRGGMGVVRVAWDEEGAAVAIKTLPPESLAELPTRRRFERERAALDQVVHPNIVPVYDQIRHEGQLFLVMRYLEGGTLSDRIRDHRRSEPGDSKSATRWACTVALRIAEAVAAAHDAGVIHRDIKPGNILFDEDGTPFIADFGLASLEEASTLTAVGEVLGTAPYIAPERLSNPERASDQRVDVYSLGVTLFEAVTGVRPFQGSLPEILAGARRGPRSLRVFLGGNHRVLDAILERCLAYRPGKRYGSMREFAADLRGYLDGGPVRALAGARRRSAQRLVAQHSWWALTLAASLLVSIGLTVNAVVGSVKGARELQRLIRSAESDLEAFREVRRELAALGEDFPELMTNDWKWLGTLMVGDLSGSRCDAYLRRLNGRTMNDMNGDELLAFADDYKRLRVKYLQLQHRGVELLASSEQALEAALARQPERPSAIESLWRLLRSETLGWYGEQGWEVAAAPGAPGPDSPVVIDPPASLTVRASPPDSKLRLLVFGEEGDDGRPLIEVDPGHEFVPSRRLDGVEPGSYVVELQRPGAERWIRYPVLLNAGEDHVSTLIEIPTDEQIGVGWEFIPPGWFLAGGDLNVMNPERAQRRYLPGFFMQRHEVSMRECRLFLVDLVERGLYCEEWFGSEKTGNEIPGVPIHVPRDSSDGRGHRLTEEQVLAGSSRNDWRPDCAVHSISWHDALHYVRWLNKRAVANGEPWVYALPTGDEWEKAARGADGRRYAWGNVFNWKMTWGNHTPYLDPVTPRETWYFVGNIEGDRSPYGIRDMVGNFTEFCSDLDPMSGSYLVRGGEQSYIDPKRYQLLGRRGASQRMTNWHFGIRLVRRLRK